MGCWDVVRQFVVRYKMMSNGKEIKTEPYCIFCDNTDVWLYCSYNGEGICEVCIRMAALALRDRMICLDKAKRLFNNQVKQIPLEPLGKHESLCQARH